MIRLSVLVAFISFSSIAHAAEPRIVLPIDADWTFSRGDVAGAEATAFDDAAWSHVTLPHTWTADDINAHERHEYRGPAWYRLHLPVGAELAGKSLFLRFGAASLVAHVYVNGQDAGTHAGGFGAFCVDVTKLAHAGDNVVAVRVDNALNPDVTPISGDFTVAGGLYRHAELLALAPVSITPLDDASPGVYLKQSNVSDASVDVDVTTKLRNATADAVTNALVTCDVADAEGHVVAHCAAAKTIPANGTVDAVGHLTIAKPHRWNGRLDPYLYTATITVNRDGGIVDRITQPLGIRSFRVDAKQGFILNDKPYDLHGVNIHQGRAGVSWASSDADIDEDYAIVSELGCTAVRMAHYQHADREYAVCDRAGLVVWAELALVNKVTPSDAFYAGAKQQLRELIKQNYNHPSICFWSLYNEPWVNKEMPLSQWKIVSELHELSHEIDPTRLTTGAVTAGGGSPLNWVMDVTGINRYWGWYSEAPGDGPAGIAKIQRESGGEHTFGLSEYGAGASIHQHEVDPQPVKPGSHWHPEEWQAIVHEGIWPALHARPWMWCKFLWVMYDFDSAGRDEGDAYGINDKGLVTADRKTRKDAFYYYKANWTTEPFAYVTDRRFDPHPAGPTPLKVYSNCATVELFLDNTSLGERPGVNGVFTWPSTTLSLGHVRLRAVGHANGKEFVDEIAWTITADAPAHPPTTTATTRAISKRPTSARSPG